MQCPQPFADAKDLELSNRWGLQAIRREVPQELVEIRSIGFERMHRYVVTAQFLKKALDLMCQFRHGREGTRPCSRAPCGRSPHAVLSYHAAISGGWLHPEPAAGRT